MKRVASLYLPDWPIDRLRRAERSTAPPDTARDDRGAGLDDLGPLAAAERAKTCSVPRGGGWRPGARWARAEVEAEIDRLPSHQRPPMRELGRSDVATENPFKHPETRGHSNADPPVPAWTGALAHAPREMARRTEALDHPFRPHSSSGPPDEGAPSLAEWAAMPAVQYPGEGPHPDSHGRLPPPGYPGAGRFFQTGRTLGDVVARACPERPGAGWSRPRAGDAPPLVTAVKVDGRVEIAAASPAARALGLAPGLALTQARAQAPGLDIRDADPAGDAADLQAMAVAFARRWTPAVAVSGADGLFLDLTGVAHLHGGEERLARRLVRLLARLGVTARIAIADTAGAAWALARYSVIPAKPVLSDCRRQAVEGAGIAVSEGASSPQATPACAGVTGWEVMPPGRHHAALAPLPVAALRLDEPATELLKRLGVDTVGQLLALPRGPLVRRFGAGIARRIDQATGALPEPLDLVTAPTPVVATQRFAEPIATPEAIAHWLGQLMPRLCAALAQAGQGARLVELVADRVDGVPQRLRIGLARPTRDAAHLLRLTLRRIEEVAPGYGLDALHLHVRRADPLAAESLAPALAGEAAPDLAPLIDTLANRIGPAALWRTRPVESDIPERSVAPCPPLDPPARAAPTLKQDDIRQLDGRAPDHPWHPRWPRPARLLRRPERLDHVLAVLPDQPPRRFTWRGTRHEVVRADGPERITGEWWRRPAERAAVRDYFAVEDEAGQRFWLFRRGDGLRPETGDLSWYLHGAFG